MREMLHRKFKMVDIKQWNMLLHVFVKVSTLISVPQKHKYIFWTTDTIKKYLFRIMVFSQKVIVQTI